LNFESVENVRSSNGVEFEFKFRHISTIYYLLSTTTTITTTTTTTTTYSQAQSFFISV